MTLRDETLGSRPGLIALQALQEYAAIAFSRILLNEMISY